MERTVRIVLDRAAEADLAVRGVRVTMRSKRSASPPEAAERRRRRSALRREVLRLVADEEDLAERRRVRDDMDTLAAPWPED